MTDRILSGICLYTPGGAAREYAAVGCNFYRGCPYQCSYCFNRKGRNKKVMGIDHAVLENKFTNISNRPKKYRDLSGEEYAMTVFRMETDKDLDYLRETGIFFSFSTDPMCEGCVSLTLEATGYALSKGVPVKILTKNAFWSPDTLSFFEGLSPEQRRLLAVGFTLTGCDDWEPNASPNEERVSLMKMLHGNGFRTFASVEPVIDWESSYQMIEKTLGFCDLYLIGTMSHFKDFYKTGSGTSFKAGQRIRNIFRLQQLFNLKIYFKESIRHYMPDLMAFLYDSDKDASVLPVSMDYDMFNDKSGDPLEQVIHSLSYLNRHNGFLLGYEYKTGLQEQEDIFLLWKFFMMYGDTDRLEDFVHITYVAQAEQVYNEVKRLLTQASTFLTFLHMLGNFRKIMYQTGKKETDILPWLKIFAYELIEISNDVINEHEQKDR